MSLVGPRPVVGYEVDAYPDWYLDRFAVQARASPACGRSAAATSGPTRRWSASTSSTRERQSVRLDIRIMFKTIWVVLSGRGVA